MGIDVHVRREADACLRAAQAEAERIGTAARRRADALATAADRSLATARAEAAGMVERARSLVAAAERDAARLRAEAEEHLASARELERRAALAVVRSPEQSAVDVPAQAAGSSPGTLTAATTAP